jgi:hypothetical protein
MMPLPSQPEEALTDADLQFMAERAWRHAARSWSEARQYARAQREGGDVTEAVVRMLYAEAESAEATWRRLANEQKRRAPHFTPTSPSAE